LEALLGLLRPVADELVVGLDERVDLTRLGRVPGLVDTLVRYPYAEPVERPRGWLASLCHGDWLFSIDDDEAPSAGLLERLRAPPDGVTHALVRRRWLWRQGWLAADPWTPDWQLRLFRADAVFFPGVMHIPIKAFGPHVYLDEPLYHLDLLVNSREQREEKTRRYERIRPGRRLGGLSLNAAYFLPELRTGLELSPVPPQDAALVQAVLEAADSPPGDRVEVRTAGRAEIDAHWLEGTLPPHVYAARIEVSSAPHCVTGELRQVDVAVTNLGTTTWAFGEKGLPEIRLPTRIEGSDLAGLRTPFSRPVEPGATVTIPVSFEAPREPGQYTLVVDIVHERHRWFGADAAVELHVAPRRRAIVLVGQPAGDDAYDRRVDEALAHLDPHLEAFLVGPRPEWLRDRFGLEAAAEPPRWAPDQVVVVPAGRRRHRIALQLQAQRLRRRART
jgi:hypothetical protein